MELKELYQICTLIINNDDESSLEMWLPVCVIYDTWLWQECVQLSHVRCLI